MGIRKPSKPAALPGESEASQATAGVATSQTALIGHNNPPPHEQIGIDFREGMFEKLPTWEQRIKDLAASADRAVVNDPISAGKAGDLVKSIRAMSAAITDVHKTVKEPFLLATRTVDGIKNQHMADLDAAKRVIEGKQTNFLREEEAKREKARREAAARAKAEADAAAAAERARRQAEEANDIEALEEVEAVAAPAVFQQEPEKIRSADTGVAVGGRKEWECEVTDHSVAVIDMLEDAKVREAIENCAKRRMKAGMTNQPGVRCWQALKARTY